MSTGIDLDDKDGKFPRIAFVSPNYSSINLYQLGFRFLRADTKSATELYFVYVAHAHESKILKVLSAKSKVMKETTPEQVDNGVIFPNDHTSFYELPPDDFTPREVYDPSSARTRAYYLRRQARLARETQDQTDEEIEAAEAAALAAEEVATEVENSTEEETETTTLNQEVLDDVEDMDQ
jgi:hypothetical protein